MDKYELRNGEEFINEYIDEDGKHITILKDINGEIKHAWILDMDDNTIRILTKLAVLKGQTLQDYIDEAIENVIILLIEEAEMRQALEEISD